MDIEYIKIITASDLVSWVLAFVGGFVAYLVIDHLQTTMERHNVIADIESKINDLYSNKIAKVKTGEELETVMVRTVLHDFSNWEFTKEVNPIVIDGQRYVNIRNNDNHVEYISTQALHETLILFRRLEKLYKSKIIKSIDLSDLWREILPYGGSKRLEFYKKYYSVNDIESMLFVIMHTVLACNKLNNEPAIKYFVEQYRMQGDETTKLFEENSRYRWVDKISLKAFFRIVSS